MTTPVPVVQAVDVTKTFGRGQAATVAVNHTNLSIDAGQWTAITGPSGSGKTTLLHCLAGLMVPDSGTITLTGRDGTTTTISSLSDRARARIRRTRIGIVFQDFNLVPVLSVANNITLPMRLAHKRWDKAWFGQITDRLGIDDRLRHLPHELSGGQRQRVAIARALLARPDIIFADEPTGNLDSEATANVLELFRSIRDDFGQTLVVVTHDPAAAACADRVITVVDGTAQPAVAPARTSRHGR